MQLICIYWPCIMQPCWINLLNLIVYFCRLLSVIYIDDDIYKQWQFNDFFPIYEPFISVSCSTVLVVTSRVQYWILMGRVGILDWAGDRKEARRVWTLALKSEKPISIFSYRREREEKQKMRLRDFEANRGTLRDLSLNGSKDHWS